MSYLSNIFSFSAARPQQRDNIQRANKIREAYNQKSQKCREKLRQLSTEFFILTGVHLDPDLDQAARSRRADRQDEVNTVLHNTVKEAELGERLKRLNSPRSRSSSSPRTSRKGGKNRRNHRVTQQKRRGKI
jgi:hypothetical protein